MFPFLLHRPDRACPHCGLVGISWKDKQRCGVDRTPCKCSFCDGLCTESWWKRLFSSLATYGAYILLLCLGVGVVTLLTRAGLMGETGPWIAAALLFLLWFPLHYLAQYYATLRLPLVAIQPPPTGELQGWAKFKDVAGVIIGALMLLCLTLIIVAQVAMWIRAKLGI